jgi:hypothetical protein
VVVFVYQAVEDGFSPDAMGREVGDGGRAGRFGTVWMLRNGRDAE